MAFADRADAGRQLAAALAPQREARAVVLGLPRGGVPVAWEVAHALRAPLDVIVVRKLGVPFQPELAMGAIGEGGVCVLNDDVLHATNVAPTELRMVEERERAELERRVTDLRRGRPRVDLHGRTAIIVDDGIATGATARAACKVARALGAARIVLATPGAPRETVTELRHEVDEIVCLEMPEPFFAVGQLYRRFPPTTDDEVRTLLDEAGDRIEAVDLPAVDADVEIAGGPHPMSGRLTVPAGAAGIVLFAHGSGSSRFSPRNRSVADALVQRGFGTLLFDLLTEAEETDRANVFDVELLAERLVAATTWVSEQPVSAGRPLGYFGASTGAAAALWAATELGDGIAAVVSRGGRPDLAAARLDAVRAPTLLIVGSRDSVVLGLNQEARRQLHCLSELAIVPGATHLFTEPGTLEQVATLAGDWYAEHFAR